MRDIQNGRGPPRGVGHSGCAGAGAAGAGKGDRTGAGRQPAKCHCGRQRRGRSEIDRAPACAAHYGRVSFLPQHPPRIRIALRSRSACSCNKPGVLGCASELISFSQDVRPAMTFLLGRTVVAKDLDAGIAVTRRCPFSFRCVTLLGDILQSGGAMTGGSVRERGLVSRERLIAQAAQKGAAGCAARAGAQGSNTTRCKGVSGIAVRSWKRNSRPCKRYIRPR